MKHKDLIIKDLSARVPYDVKCEVVSLTKKTVSDAVLTPKLLTEFINGKIELRPYLRPISSMKKAEKEEILKLLFGKNAEKFYVGKTGYIDANETEKDFFNRGFLYPTFNPGQASIYINWLNKNHFDYNNLIKKDAAYKL